MWLPYNGNPNQIIIGREKHLTYSVTDFEDENELVDFNNNIGNYSAESFLGKFNAQKLCFLDNSVTSQNENFSQTDSSKCINLVDKPLVKSLFRELYFDGSKSNDCAGVGCILISPNNDSM